MARLADPNRGMSWFRVDVGAWRRGDVQDFCDAMESPTAWAYVIATWDWFAQYHPSGIAAGVPDRHLERALEWRGKPGELVAMLIKHKQLARAEKGLQSVGWERHNGPLFRKFKKDRERHAEAEESGKQAGDSVEPPELIHGGIQEPPPWLAATYLQTNERTDGTNETHGTDAPTPASETPPTPERSEDDRGREASPATTPDDGDDGTHQRRAGGDGDVSTGGIQQRSGGRGESPDVGAGRGHGLAGPQQGGGVAHAESQAPEVIDSHPDGVRGDAQAPEAARQAPVERTHSGADRGGTDGAPASGDESRGTATRIAGDTGARGPASGNAGTQASGVTRKADASENVLTVLTYWRDKVGMPRADILAKPRTQRIARWLKEGWSVERLCLVVDGALKDGWLMGLDPGSKGYRDVETIFRDVPQLERLEGYALNESMPLARKGQTGHQSDRPKHGWGTTDADYAIKAGT